MVKFLLKISSRKPLVQHLHAGEFINHAGVQQQVAGGPAGCTQQAQQALMHIGALQQQCQIALAAQQGLYPVGQPHCSDFCGLAVVHPLGGAGNQADQPCA